MKVICRTKGQLGRSIWKRNPCNTEMNFAFSGQSDWGWVEGYECPMCDTVVLIVIDSSKEEEICK